MKNSRVLRGRQRVLAAAWGPPHFSAGASPVKSLWAEPAAAGGAVALPSEGWVALSGGQAEGRRRSMGGAEPAGESSNQSINQVCAQKSTNGRALVVLAETILCLLLLYLQNEQRTYGGTLRNTGRFPVSYLLSRTTLSGRVNQELVEQVNSLRACIRDDLLQWDCWVLLKGDFVVVWKLHDLLQRHHHSVM